VQRPFFSVSSVSVAASKGVSPLKVMFTASTLARSNHGLSDFGQCVFTISGRIAASSSRKYVLPQPGAPAVARKGGRGAPVRAAEPAGETCDSASLGSSCLICSWKPRNAFSKEAPRSMQVGNVSLATRFRV
jgi:hypothetical protein